MYEIIIFEILMQINTGGFAKLQAWLYAILIA